MRIIAILCVLIFIATACQNKQLNKKQLTAVSAVREISESTKPAADDRSQETTTTPENTRIQKPDRLKTGSQYHIIVASFAYSERNRAEKLLKSLRAKEYPAAIIDLKGRLRVSIETLTDRKEAYIARDKYREITDRQDIWILETKQ